MLFFIKGRWIDVSSSFSSTLVLLLNTSLLLYTLSDNNFKKLVFTVWLKKDFYYSSKDVFFLFYIIQFAGLTASWFVSKRLNLPGPIFCGAFCNPREGLWMVRMTQICLKKILKISQKISTYSNFVYYCFKFLNVHRKNNNIFKLK